MLDIKQIMEALGGVSRNYALKLLMNSRIRFEKRSSRNGKKIYFDITREQILSGMLEEKDRKKITMQQSTALMLLEAQLNRPKMRSSASGEIRADYQSARV